MGTSPSAQQLGEVEHEALFHRAAGEAVEPAQRDGDEHEDDGDAEPRADARPRSRRRSPPDPPSTNAGRRRDRSPWPSHQLPGGRGPLHGARASSGRRPRGRTNVLGGAPRHRVHAEIRSRPRDRPRTRRRRSAAARPLWTRRPRLACCRWPSRSSACRSSWPSSPCGARPWYPVLDLAMTEFRVRDVGTSHTPLIGLPGRIGEYPDQGSHPGPLSFYLLAPDLPAARLVVVGAGGGHRRRSTSPPSPPRCGSATAGSAGRASPSSPRCWPSSCAATARSADPAVEPVPPAAGRGSSCCSPRGRCCAATTSMLIPLVVAAPRSAPRPTCRTCRSASGWSPSGSAPSSSAPCRARPETERRGAAAQRGAGPPGVGVVLWLPPRRRPAHATTRATSASSSTTSARRPRRPSASATASELALRHLDVWAGPRRPARRDRPFVTDASAGRGASRWSSGLVAAVVAWRVGSPALRALHVVVAVALVLGIVSMARIFGRPWFYLTLWAWGVTAAPRRRRARGPRWPGGSTGRPRAGRSGSAGDRVAVVRRRRRGRGLAGHVGRVRRRRPPRGAAQQRRRRARRPDVRRRGRRRRRGDRARRPLPGALERRRRHRQPRLRPARRARAARPRRRRRRVLPRPGHRPPRRGRGPRPTPRSTWPPAATSTSGGRVPDAVEVASVRPADARAAAEYRRRCAAGFVDRLAAEGLGELVPLVDTNLFGMSVDPRLIGGRPGRPDPPDRARPADGRVHRPAARRRRPERAVTDLRERRGPARAGCRGASAAIRGRSPGPASSAASSPTTSTCAAVDAGARRRAPATAGSPTSSLAGPAGGRRGRVLGHQLPLRRPRRADRRAHRAAPRAARRRFDLVLAARRARARRGRRVVPRRRRSCPLLADGGTPWSACRPTRACSRDHDRMLEHHRRYRPTRAAATSSPATCDVVASGSLFTSLLAPTGGDRRPGAARPPAATRPASVRGTAGRLVTAAITGVLDADAAIGRRLARQRLRARAARLPGLSTLGGGAAMTSARRRSRSSCRATTRPPGSTPTALTELSTAAGARLLLVDDGSTDTTRGRLAALAPSRPGAVRGGHRSRPTSARARPCGWGCAAPCRTAPPSSATSTPTWPRPRRRWPAWSAIAARAARPRRGHRRARRPPRPRHPALDGPPLPRPGVRHRQQHRARPRRLRHPVRGEGVPGRPSLRAALAEPFESRWVFDVELLGRLHRGSGGVSGLPASAFLEVPLNEWHDVHGTKLGLRSAARAGRRPGPHRRHGRRCTRWAARTGRRSGGPGAAAARRSARRSRRPRGPARRSRRSPGPASSPLASSGPASPPTGTTTSSRSMRPARTASRPALGELQPVVTGQLDHLGRAARRARLASAGSSPSHEGHGPGALGRLLGRRTLEEHEPPALVPVGPAALAELAHHPVVLDHHVHAVAGRARRAPARCRARRSGARRCRRAWARPVGSRRAGRRAPSPCRCRRGRRSGPRVRRRSGGSARRAAPSPRGRRARRRVAAVTTRRPRPPTARRTKAEIGHNQRIWWGLMPMTPMGMNTIDTSAATTATAASTPSVRIGRERHRRPADDHDGEHDGDGEQTGQRGGARRRRRPRRGCGPWDRRPRPWRG